jgi:hypothetical protein
MYSKVIPDAIKSDGTKFPYETGKGYDLPAGTYFVDASLPDARDVGVHVWWDAVIAGTVNYQDSNLPAFKSLTNPYTDNSGAADVSNRDAATGATLGVWLPQNGLHAHDRRRHRGRREVRDRRCAPSRTHGARDRYWRIHQDPHAREASMKPSTSRMRR